MGCPGCDYTSECGSYSRASYMPSADSSASYSHSTAEPVPMYQHADNNPGNGYLPIELDYHVSKALKEIEEKRETLPVETEGSVTVVPNDVEVIAPKRVEPDNQEVLNLEENTRRITEIEEQTLILKRRKVRVISRN
jgi:hypothetical protein